MRSPMEWTQSCSMEGQLRSVPRPERRTHSHSIVAGGFDVQSSTTRLIWRHSFVMRVEIVASTSYGTRDQSAVIASSELTGRSTIGMPYVRSSPCTPTECTSASSTTGHCQMSRSRPAFDSSSRAIASASRRMSSRSFVISPMMRMPRPGPGTAGARRSRPAGRARCRSRAPHP